MKTVNSWPKQTAVIEKGKKTIIEPAVGFVSNCKGLRRHALV